MVSHTSYNLSEYKGNIPEYGKFKIYRRNKTIFVLGYLTKDKLVRLEINIEGESPKIFSSNNLHSAIGFLFNTNFVVFVNSILFPYMKKFLGSNLYK